MLMPTKLDPLLDALDRRSKNASKKIRVLSVYTDSYHPRMGYDEKLKAWHINTYRFMDGYCKFCGSEIIKYSLIDKKLLAIVIREKWEE